MSAITELPAPGDYVFDNAWEHARRRLTLLEQCFDAGTIRRLRCVGIQPGWRCLEAIAGAGSIARWLCSQVGPGGRVLAVDLDTRFLDQLDEPNLDVAPMDLRTDELPRDSFDLVHARGLLMHIPQRQQILDRLLAALRPGGVLLLGISGPTVRPRCTKAVRCIPSSGGSLSPRPATSSCGRGSARSGSINGTTSSPSRAAGFRAWRWWRPAAAVPADHDSRNGNCHHYSHRLGGTT